jgi:hypothetical protein
MNLVTKETSVPHGGLDGFSWKLDGVCVSEIAILFSYPLAVILSTTHVSWKGKYGLFYHFSDKNQDIWLVKLPSHDHFMCDHFMRSLKIGATMDHFDWLNTGIVTFDSIYMSLLSLTRYFGRNIVQIKLIKKQHLFKYLSISTVDLIQDWDWRS